MKIQRRTRNRCESILLDVQLELNVKSQIVDEAKSVKTKILIENMKTHPRGNGKMSQIVSTSFDFCILC